jgi:rod shape-determining protein MreC
MPAAITRHGSFFLLLGFLLAQLLLLSVQITRNQNIPLVHIWAESIFSPFERGFHDMVQGPTQVWNAVRDLRADRQENQNLGAQLVEARARIRGLSEKAAEADRLRALLNFKQKLPYASLAAEVIASNPGEGSATVLINRGEDSGLTPDMPVITPDGVAGKILAVYPNTAQVRLITDPSSGVGCMLATSRTQGVLKGNAQNTCELQYVMDDDKVPVGEEVLTSGLDQIYPKGLLVGYVRHVEDGNIYKHIVVKPAASLSRLEDVLILKATAGQRQARNQGNP